jgi:hypothetical protein
MILSTSVLLIITVLTAVLLQETSGKSHVSDVSAGMTSIQRCPPAVYVYPDLNCLQVATAWMETKRAHLFARLRLLFDFLQVTLILLKRIIK